jgi:toxin ParE1/3/4
MSYTLVIPEFVQIEISNALDYYYDIDAAVGDRFFHLLVEAYNSLEENPQHYSFYGSSEIIRSLALIKYPYIILFRIRGDQVIFAAFHNTHQNRERFLNQI